jgi:hypothetical protein
VNTLTHNKKDEKESNGVDLNELLALLAKFQQIELHDSK